MDKDLFGNPIIKDVLLRGKFIEPPFSVLDTKSGSWQNRKREWIARGLKSEIGRGENLLSMSERASLGAKDTSTFDPALTELLYRWFCPGGGYVLDPFAGGSVRGIVAHYLGYKYAGIELRREQVESNEQQAADILPVNNRPRWLIGDSDKILEGDWKCQFDFMLSCPPYFNLEVYSDLPDDISNMTYPKFLEKYRSIIKKSIALLKPGAFIGWVVGEVRDKKTGFYLDFVGDTKRAFIEQGAGLYNDAILLNVIGSASMRADKVFSSNKKLVKIHQNVLVFKKY